VGCGKNKRGDHPEENLEIIDGDVSIKTEEMRK
jgi:hypothetical protein